MVISVNSRVLLPGICDYKGKTCLYILTVFLDYYCAKFAHKLTAKGTPVSRVLITRRLDSRKTSTDGQKKNPAEYA